MADRVVYVGSYNNYKSEELIDKALDYLKQNNGDKFYYILPNGNLLTKYRKTMIEEVGQTFNINLFTFDNIVDRLLEDYLYINIDGEMKEAILSKIFTDLDLENKLKFYKNIYSKKGFIKIIANIIGEIKRSLVTPKTYLSKCPSTLFYREIGLVYEIYEKELHRLGLLDREESFFKALSILKGDNSFFDGLDFIIIDGFFDFRPQELELLREITKTNCPIYINMPFERGENFNTLNETIEILKDLGFKIQYLEKENPSYYEQMANLIFTEDGKKLKPNPNIYTIKAANIYLELKKICEEIKRQYINGIELQDMALILVNPDKYRNKMFKVFQEERIPCSLDKNINLIEIPLIKEIVHILNLKKNNMDKTSIINRIKSNYFSLCNVEEREATEYFLRKLNFNGIDDLLNSEKLKKIVYMPNVEEIIFSIKEEAMTIPKKASIAKYVESILYLLDKYSIEERILDIYNNTEDYNLLNRDLASLNKFRDILDNLNKFIEILYDEVTLEEFLRILESYLENENILDTKGNRNGINILTPVTARGQKFQIVFVAGLSQGKYPNIGQGDFFFNEKNYNELKEIGIDVKNYYEKLDKESLMFTTILSSSSRTLYLSYSENATGDEKDIPSIFLDEIFNRIEGNKLEEKMNLITVDMDYLLKDKPNMITTKKELAQYLIGKYYEGECDEELFAIYNAIDSTIFKEINDRILCEYERSRKDYNEYSGYIEDEYIANDIEHIHKNKIYSISYLESYGKCPYYFLLNNILNIEEMGRVFQDFQPLDRGIINHEVLKDYYSKYRVEIENHILERAIFNVNDTYEYIVDKIEKKMKFLGLNTEGKIWKLRIENNGNKILELIKKDLDRLQKLKKKAIPMDFEVDFGRKENFIIEVDGIKIPFTGVIDRIDKYVDENKYIVIDYKSSDFNVKDIDHMREGLSFQLPLYILSQKDKRVVAGIYGIISKGEFQLKIGDVEESHLVNKSNKGAITSDEIEKLLDTTKYWIKSYIDLIHKGDFSVNPKECSPYCIYRDICRYKGLVGVE